ncbi:hypothetical protein [Xenorhabdus griffiniae]|uniref:hypothetical protein n=1 Tax=Xenorhabdus griffiniae TaxID=351672 RepID=UPI00167A966B|nr:hypothetical protein [Xenorhabdus griffiniae]
MICLPVAQSLPFVTVADVAGIAITNASAHYLSPNRLLMARTANLRDFELPENPR